jgi:hypothetical protein
MTNETEKTRQGAQGDQVIGLLKSGASITPMEALVEFGCFRLAAVIHKLRKKGWLIRTTIIRDGDKHYASYSLTGVTVRSTPPLAGPQSTCTSRSRISSLNSNNKRCSYRRYHA